MTSFTVVTPSYAGDFELCLDLHRSVLDNTPRDIREAALDMADLVEGESKLLHPQRVFNKLLMQAGRELPRDWTGLQGIALLRRPKGALSRRFARRYLSA